MENLTQPTPVAQPVIEEAPKSKNKLLIPFIICAILAVAGCGFSIYTLVTANSKNNTTTTTTKKSNTKISPIIDNDQTDPDTISTDDEGDTSAKISSSDFVIRSDDSDELKYRVSVKDNFGTTTSSAISIDAAGSEPSVLNIHINNAKSLKDIYEVDYSGPTELTVDFSQGIVDAHISAFGQAAGSEFIFVVLTDGTVHYIPIYQSVKNGVFTVAGKVDGLSNIVRILDGDVCNVGCGMQPFAQDVNGDIMPIPQLN